MSSDSRVVEKRAYHVGKTPNRLSIEICAKQALNFGEFSDATWRDQLAFFGFLDGMTHGNLALGDYDYKYLCLVSIDWMC
jgi:hypothetical protein